MVYYCSAVYITALIVSHRFKTGQEDIRDVDVARIDGHPGCSVAMLLEKAVDVKPTLGMREAVERTVETRFPAAFREAAEPAMATAR